MSRRVAALPALVVALLAALPSVYLLLRAPPSFVTSDSYCLLTFPLRQLIPHYPALYPLFLKLLSGHAGVSDLQIHLAVAVQHVLFVAGALLVASAFARFWQRIVVVLGLLVGDYLLVLTHCICTEGMSQSLLVLLLGVDVHLYLGADRPVRRSARVAGWIGHGLLLLLATLTRHNNPVFLLVLPTCFTLRSLFERRLRPLRHAALALVVGVIAVAAAGITNRLVVRAIDGDPTSVFGRNAMYRMQRLPWASMSEEERITLRTRIAARTEDPRVRRAITIMIHDPDWTVAYNHIRVLATTDPRHRSTDELMNEAALAFYREPHNPWLLREIRDSFWWYLTYASNYQFFSGLGPLSIASYREDPGTPPAMRQLPMVRSIDVRHYQRLHFHLDPALFDGCCLPLYGGLLALLVLIPQFWFRRAQFATNAALVIGLMLTALIYTLATAVVTVNVQRYVLPTGLGMWLAAALAIATWGRRGSADH